LNPWRAYSESFNGSMRDKVLNGEIFYILAEAQILIEAWRRHCNTVRPHSSLGDRPPALKTTTSPWLPSGSATLHLRAALAPEAVLY
jgi:putative transposase